MDVYDGETVESSSEIEDDDPWAACETLLDDLISEHQPNVLRPVAVALRAYYQLAEYLNEAKDEPWFTSIETPRVNFPQRSVTIAMHCEQGIEIRLSALNEGLLDYSCQIWVDRPDSPASRGIADNIYAGVEELRFIVTAIYISLQHRPLTHKETLQVGEEARRQRTGLLKQFEDIRSCLLTAFEAENLSKSIRDPSLSFDDQMLKLSASAIAFEGESFFKSEAYAGLDITIYADGHVRLEHDRRDVASPADGVKALKATLTEGRGSPTRNRRREEV